MITSINAVADTWQNWVVASSWQIALLVLVVAALVVMLRNRSPRLRHGLWLLVLLKVFLPPSLALPTGIGTWGIAKLIAPVAKDAPSLDQLSQAALEFSEAVPDNKIDHSAALSPPAYAMLLWATGAILFWVCVVTRYAKISRTIRSGTPIDEGPVRIAMEKSAMSLGVNRTPDLYVTEALTSPFLFGVIRPCVVLPRRLISGVTDAELSAVLTHELVHLSRRDTWIGWVQVVAQGLFWFHPLLWWAGRELRHHREEACDESVLRQGGVDPERYGETMLRVLTSAKARSLAEAGFLGVFERGTQLQIRLEQIMNYEHDKRPFGIPSKIALATFALVMLPMANGTPSQLDAHETNPVAASTSPATKSTAATDTRTAQPRTAYPRIVRTVPAVGATEVKTSVKEIRVIFDQDMSTGMSWTGGGPEFPPVDSNRKARWINKRTCVLPVKLQRGKYYRVGMNSKSFLNFRSENGVPSPPSAIYFATTGASPDVVAKARRPEIIRMIPSNGATDVDPSLRWIKVTFNMPMGGGMSWTGGGENFPKSAEGKRPQWSKDKRSCAFPVQLEPDHAYKMGLNSLSHRNFQSEPGVPLQPVVYEFKTKTSSKETSSNDP